MTKRRTNRERHNLESQAHPEVEIKDHFGIEESKARVKKYQEDREFREIRKEARKAKKQSEIEETKARRKNLSGLPDPEESWALVEFYRQEHGELPPPDTNRCKPMSIKATCKKVADKFKGPREDWVDPYNTMMMLAFMQKHIKASPQVDKMQDIVDLIRQNKMSAFKLDDIITSFEFASENYNGPYA